MPIRRFPFLALLASPAWASTAQAGMAGADLVALLEGGGAWLARTAGGRSAAEGPIEARARPLIELAPCATVVLRDWRGSFHVVGAPSLLLDDVRPAASSRMVVVRVASSGQLVSFAQVGAGEWRIDPVLFPRLVAAVKKPW